MIAIGLYAVLWGKEKDSMISTDKISSEVHSNCPLMHPANANQNEMYDIEATSNYQPMTEEPQARQVLCLFLFIYFLFFIFLCKS